MSEFSRWIEYGEEIARDPVSVTYSVTLSGQNPVWVTRYPLAILSPATVQAMSRMAERVQQIQSDWVVPLLHHGQDATYFYVVHEALTPYQPLLHRLKTTPPETPSEWVELMRQLLAAALAVSRYGVAHGTLSLCSYVKRGDAFALWQTGVHALALQHHWPHVTAYDMSLFLAPEWVLGIGRLDGVDDRLDLYAIGVLLYLLVSGKWPYPFTTQPAVLCEHMGTPFQPVHCRHLPDSEPLKSLITQLLDHHPEARPAQLAWVWSTFENAMTTLYQDAEPVEVRGSSSDHDTAPTMTVAMASPLAPSRRKWWALVGVVVLLVMVGGYRWVVHYVTSLSTSKVPNVIGMSIEDASLLLQDMKLRVQVAGSRESDAMPDGMVADIKPEVGTEVKENRLILLFRSVKKTQWTIPNLQGQTLTQAKAITHEMGVPLSVDDQQYSLTIPAGEIISQTATPNMVASINGRMGVVVSKGFPIELTVQPNSSEPGMVMVTIQTAVLEGWPPQHVTMVYRSGAGAMELISKTLAPLATASDTFSLAPGGDIEVYFNDRLAIRKRLHAIKPRG
ncbi:PASTA domain-containing protein [bacterium]|nr:PASTA domain-containing protein [bacterium]